MRTSPSITALGGAVLGALLASVFAFGAPPTVPVPVPPAPAAPHYEYAVRCVFRGAETGILANYKLRCTELGSEVAVCGPLEFEACRMKVVNDMGRQGWRYLGVDEVGGLGPGGSVTFEREIVTGSPVEP